MESWRAEETVLDGVQPRLPVRLIDRAGRAGHTQRARPIEQIIGRGVVIRRAHQPMRLRAGQRREQKVVGGTRTTGQELVGAGGTGTTASVGGTTTNRSVGRAVDVHLRGRVAVYATETKED